MISHRANDPSETKLLLRLCPGLERFLDVDATTADVEWQANNIGVLVSLFAHSAIGDDR